MSTDSSLSKLLTAMEVQTMRVKDAHAAVLSAESAHARARAILQDARDDLVRQRECACSMSSQNFGQAGIRAMDFAVEEIRKDNAAFETLLLERALAEASARLASAEAALADAKAKRLAAVTKREALAKLLERARQRQRVEALVAAERSLGEDALSVAIPSGGMCTRSIDDNDNDNDNNNAKI